MANEEVTEPWGWESYFTELARFLQSSQRQFENQANQQYAEYVIDRLAVCSRNVTVLRERIEEAEQNASSEVERHSLLSLHSLLNELLHLLPQLHVQWQHHLDDIEALTTLSSSVPFEVNVTGRFRSPRHTSTLFCTT